MNLNEIRKTLDIFKAGQLVEVRSFGNPVKSGYFKDFENLLKCVSANENETFYFVMNDTKEECYSREQSERIIAKPKTTTSDPDISNRSWILIDSDPQRATGISATDEEKAKAKVTIVKVYNYLRDIGFSYPIIADSGNGYHLLYNIKAENNSTNAETIKAFLNVLDLFFSDEFVKIDTAVYNASRITKLYGTVARKGSSTAERPHRESRILKVPDEIKPTTMALVKKVAELLPQPEKPTFRNNYATSFDLRDFISNHGIPIKRESSYSGGTRFVLENCVFNPEHKAPDSALFLRSDGSIGYKCFHNSCSDRTWRDVRQLFDPHCYELIEQQPRTTKPFQSQPEPTQATIAEVYPFLKLSDIEYLDRSKIVSIKTGFSALDKKIIGSNKGELSIWSGGNGSGKSTVLSQIALEAVDDGFKVAMFSGELTANRMKNWLHLQAAGRQYTKLATNGMAYYIPTDIGNRVDKWVNDSLWIYNNTYGVDVSKVLMDFKRHMETHSTDMVIIDNLMSLDLTKMQGDKYDKQTMVVLELANMAKAHNLHIHFVCHPKKPQGFLRKTDISGTADLTNAADNVFMVHRVNSDFKKLSKEYLTEPVAKKFFGFSNVIEVMKNRDLGIQDEIIGLYFETESKRMLNEQYENKVYGWQEAMLGAGFADEQF